MKTRIRSSLRRLEPAQLLQQPMFADRISLGMFAAGIGLNLLTFVALMFRVHAVDNPVPVHYSSLIGFDEGNGPWYSVYRLPAYGLMVAIINSGLALRSFPRNRLTSFYLLLSSIVVAVLCLIISMAFAAIV